jgi:Kdo2-lipid IVA lauroyltransferase/acyltransferase
VRPASLHVAPGSDGRRAVLEQALALLARVVGVLPRGALRACGAVLGMTAWALGIRRAHVLAAMRRARIDRAARAARRMYRALGTGVFELLWMMGHRRPVGAMADFDETSRRALEAARAKGRGIVLAASHTGNWEIAACRLAEEGSLLAVTKALRVRGFDGFTRALREGRGVELVHAGKVTARAREVLRAGGVVAMMLDQVPNKRKHGNRCAFLGADAWVDRSPAALAAWARAPLVVAAARRNDDGTHTMRVLDVHEPPAQASRAWVDRATRDATRALERFIHENPSQWLWLHRRWTVPAA